jgi:hypothetical protein
MIMINQKKTSRKKQQNLSEFMEDNDFLDGMNPSRRMAPPPKLLLLPNFEDELSFGISRSTSQRLQYSLMSLKGSSSPSKRKEPPKSCYLSSS